MAFETNVSEDEGDLFLSQLDQQIDGCVSHCQINYTNMIRPEFLSKVYIENNNAGEEVEVFNLVVLGHGRKMNLHFVTFGTSFGALP